MPRSVPPLATRVLRRHAGSLGALLGVTVLVALVNLGDVLGRWSSAVPMSWDNRFQAWTIHWVQGALMGEHELFSAATFTPSPDSLTYSDHMIGVALVLLPLRWLGLSPVGVFNTGLVLGLVADAAACYVAGYVITRRRAAAVVAGAVYALGPLAWVSTTHIHLAWRPGVPLAMALVWVLADRRAAGTGSAGRSVDRALLAALGVTIGWQSLVSFITALFVLLAVAVTLLVRARDLGRPGLLRATGAVLAGGALAAPTYLPYIRTRDRLPGFRFDLEQIGFLRANAGIVESGNVLWGDALGRPVFGTDGFHAFPGLVVIVLAVAGVAAAVTAIRRRRRTGSPATAGLARAGALGIGLVVTGGALAAGPGEGAAGEWTPFALAFRFVPGFSAARASGRFVLVLLAGAAVLAAVAVASAQDAWARRSAPPSARARIAGVAAVGLVVLGLAAEGLSTGREAMTAGPRPIDRVLASTDEDGGVLYLPVGYGDLLQFFTQEGFTIRSAAHDRPMVNGYSGFYPPSSKELASRLRDLPADAALDCLARYGIRFVVVSDLVGDTPWAGLRDPAAARPLELVTEAGGELLYRVPDRDVPPDACALPGVPS